MIIVSSMKRILNNAKRRILAKIMKKNEIRKFNDPRRKEIYQTVELTDDQKNAIDELFVKNYGKKIPYTWHRHFTAFTGNFDVRYIPELLYIPEFEKYMNADRAYTKVYSDKNILPMIAAAAGVKMPRSILSVCEGVYKDGQYNTLSEDDAVRLFADIGEVFAKPTVDTCSGVGCAVYCMQNGIDTRTGRSADEILTSMGNNCVFQERLVCHKSISDIYSGSVNTFRVITYRWRDKFYKMPAIMRIGHGGSFLDNAHAGGVFIAVDDDGTLHSTAFTEFKKEYKVHPDSRLVFDGHKIIGFERVLDSAIRMHEAMPQLGVVNWDFTIREDGEPILIEANINGGSIWLIEMAHGCGVFGDNTEDVLQWLRLMNSIPASELPKYPFGRMN